MSSSGFRAVLFDLNGVIVHYGLSDPDKSMIALVESLKATGIKTAVISNFTHAGAEAARAQNWSKIFDELVFSGEVGVSKPDPRIFQIAADKLNVPPQQCVFTDDDNYRLAGAHEIGMTTHQFVDQPTFEKELQMLGLIS